MAQETRNNAPEEIPETGLRNNFIGSEDAHAVDLGRRVRLGGQMAPNNLVFMETHSVGKIPISNGVAIHQAPSRHRGDHPCIHHGLLDFPRKNDTHRMTHEGD